MKVIYYSQPFFADCDFPLIKEMQDRGIEVRYYMPIGYNFKKSSILDFGKPVHKWGIHKSVEIEGMEKYRNCLNTDSLYFICGRCKWWWPFTWLLWINVYFHFLFYRADIIHITWQLRGWEKVLLYLPFISKKIMTVHDPLQHSGLVTADRQEQARLRCFRWANNFILFNKQQVDLFSQNYGIGKDRILVSKLGVYDSIKYLNLQNTKNLKRYILFFGQITPHKGIEYLLDAMITVHEECENLDLIIAGSGKIYFDIAPYKDKNYIHIENKYIGISELVELVSNSLIVVCPYKDATQSGVVQTAFTLNIPVIATNVGGLPEVVKNDIYGKIVPPCNSNYLAQAIIELVKDSCKLDLMKKNIKTEWLSSMSWKPIVDGYERLYKSALSK